MAREIEALRTVRAFSNSGEIATAESPREIAAAVAAGKIVIVKGAVDLAEIKRTRARIASSNVPDYRKNQSGTAKSYRFRLEDPPQTKIKGIFDTYSFAVNDPDDVHGLTVRALFDRLVTYWRSLIGRSSDVMPGSGRNCWPMVLHYPAGGGYYDWHEHPLEPTKIGLILAMSEIGVDFCTGGTEFETPFGLCNTGTSHDIGDVCLFRYDLRHRVTPVDPGLERRWDGAGRWTFIMPVR